ncbi:hypothetical protein BD626DRAFT_567801 [Schizophyllum amplum]|uniref:Uncharacterized protein n=1 Tax=Schizophyllum amplum TaxID=97359 RepID=A0A550CJH4_9AGAR|nr:hypothetical protein BD626DRAFT_567801 [Auriculariopsis ampla]
MVISTYSVRNMFLSFFLPLLLLVAHVVAQTQTVVLGGESIVEVLTTDIDGLPSTRTLQTLTATTTAATTTAATTTDLDDDDDDDEDEETTELDDEPTTTQPVVGQPADTAGVNAGDPTPFTYTTLIGGEYQEVEDIFTPSLMATVMPEATFTGSEMDYGEYTAVYPKSSNAASALGQLHVGPWLVTVAGGVVAGAALVAML